MSKKKGKILFIVHDVYQDFNKLSLGPAYLAAILKNEGHSVQIYSQDVFHQTNEDLGCFLDENEFDMIGLGFLASRYVETIRPLAEKINTHKKAAKFVLGGHGVSPIPEYVLDDIKADIAVIGEGENVIIPLIDAILNETDLNDIKGIAYITSTGVKVNIQGESVKSLDVIPFPAWELFPLEELVTNWDIPGGSENERLMCVICSRGCINRCSFCYRMEGGVRLRSIDNIYNELRILTEEYGITYVQFDDEMFIPSKRRIKEFVVMLQKLKFPIKYFCNARVELAKDMELLQMLKDSGCRFINIGFESLDQHVLDLMGKNVTVNDNYIAVESILKVGMLPGLNFIWGNPGDTTGSLKKIVDFLEKYDTQGQLRTIRPVTPYPGSPLYFKAIKEGKLRGTGDFFDKFKNSDRLTCNFTSMPDDEVYSALLEANSKLIKNYHIKTGKSKEGADAMISSFRRVYFPESLEDLRFRGARIYTKGDS